jgi:hypothetical protein
MKYFVRMQKPLQKEYFPYFKDSRLFFQHYTILQSIIVQCADIPKHTYVHLFFKKMLSEYDKRKISEF